MIKSKIALLFDSLFISIICSAVIVLWIRIYIKNANLIYFYSIIIVLLLFFVIFYFSLKSHNKKTNKNSNIKFLNNCIIKLSICDTKTYISFFEKLFSCRHISNLLFQIDNSFVYINIREELDTKDFLLAQDVFIENKNDDSNLFFIYKTKSKQFDDTLLLSQANYNLLTTDIIIITMSTKNIYPIEKATKSIPLKNKITSYLKKQTSGITRKHFKEILFSGLSLLFLSLVVPFSRYYLIMGSILLVLSVVSILKKDITPTQISLDFFDNRKTPE